MPCSQVSSPILFASAARREKGAFDRSYIDYNLVPFVVFGVSRHVSTSQYLLFFLFLSFWPSCAFSSFFGCAYCNIAGVFSWLRGGVCK